MNRAGLDSTAGAAHPAARPTTVLCAEVGGAQPGAAQSMTRYLQVLGQAATLSGGRVLHTHANGVLALFSTPDAAAAAAARMHAYTRALPETSDHPGVRIGFHAGPVGQRNDEIFGDTVNLALQLADQAKSGQISPRTIPPRTSALLCRSWCVRAATPRCTARSTCCSASWCGAMA